MITNLYSPKHLRTLDAHKSREFSEARCDALCSSVCPRHNPGAYADMMARHAGGEFPSLPPVQSDRAAAFHSFGVTR